MDRFVIAGGDEPLATDVTGKWLLVGVGKEMPTQVFLVFGGKAALRTLMGPQVSMLAHVLLHHTPQCTTTTFRDTYHLASRNSKGN